MLYLYHGTTLVCAIKVRLTLNEKKLPWQGEILHLQRGDTQIKSQQAGTSVKAELCSPARNRASQRLRGNSQNLALRSVAR
jgi:hypothetical protein